MFWNKSKPKIDEVQYAIETIRDFIDGTGGGWDWDDFISVPMRDPEAARIQGLCRQLSYYYPRRHNSEYCNADSMERLKELLAELEHKRA